ncbi:MAG: T9SS type A sorting domain-containing protein [Bacteroidales bacterium]
MKKSIILISYIMAKTTIATAKRFDSCKNQFSIKLLILFLLFSTGANAQYDKMLIGDNNNSQIVIANIDGSNLDTINLGGLSQSFYDADVDPIHEKIYMAWYYGIYSMNYDGSGFDTLVSYPAGGYSCGIAIDAANGHIYWGSTPEDKIYRADLDGTNQVTFLSGLDYVGDVDIDLVHGYLFYGQYIIGATKGLYRVGLNGTNNVTIISGYDVEYLGLDVKNGVIYFGDGGTCRKINYNGTNDNLLFNFQPGGFFVDTTNSLVYYTDMSANRVFRSDLFGANVQNLITTQLASPHGPVLFQTCFLIINTQPANQNVNIGVSAQFVLQVSGTNISYQWQTDAGLGFQNISNAGPYSGATNDTLTVSNTTLANNNQQFRCIATSISCIDTSTVAILTVLDNSGINEAVEQNLFKVYPNPTNSNINVQVNASLIGATYTITDQLGKIAMTGKLNTENSTIELSNLSGGIYMFSFGDDTKQTFTLIKN